MYYNSKEEFELHDPLASIYLKNISLVLPSNVRGFQHAFLVRAGCWVKKDKQKGSRDFIFIANSDEQKDKWITSIELLKTICVHRNFQSQYTKVLLPVKNEDDSSDIYDIKFSLVPSLKAGNANLDKSVLNSRRDSIKRKSSVKDPFPQVLIKRNLKLNVKKE